jgi:hypothetical protein
MAGGGLCISGRTCVKKVGELGHPRISFGFREKEEAGPFGFAQGRLFDSSLLCNGFAQDDPVIFRMTPLFFDIRAQFVYLPSRESKKSAMIL